MTRQQRRCTAKRQPRSLRGILIDPDKQSIEQIEYSGEYDERCRILKSDSITHVSGPPIKDSRQGFDLVMVSDDYLEPSDKVLNWFQIAGETPLEPITGRGLVIGIIGENGTECDAHISIDELRRRVRWSKRKFLGFRHRAGRIDGVPYIKTEALTESVD